MAYTQKLIKMVKELYPDSKDMHELADSGNAFLGRYLDDCCTDSLPLDTILLATSLDSLQQKARDMKRRVELYAMWCEEDPREKMY